MVGLTSVSGTMRVLKLLCSVTVIVGYAGIETTNLIFGKT